MDTKGLDLDRLAIAVYGRDTQRNRPNETTGGRLSGSR